MTATVLGQLITTDGHNMRSRFSNDAAHFWSPIVRDIWVTDPDQLRAVQPAEIPLRLHHGGEAVGRVTHLERRSADQSVWAVAELDQDVRPERGSTHYLSVEASYLPDGSDLRIDGAALCSKSAMISLAPCTFVRSGLTQDGEATWRLSAFKQNLLEHAADASKRRRRGDPVIVHEERDTSRTWHVTSRPAGQLEFRSATQVAIEGRTIEAIVMPYETATVVPVHGRPISEVVSRGAFDGLEQRSDRVSVNRDHDLTRTIGRAVGFDTHDPRGLVAELRIAKTQLGDETIVLAEDNMLDLSAGFRVVEEKWETSDRRRLNRLWLHHIALTPDPAYTTAHILAVRGAAQTL